MSVVHPPAVSQQQQPHLPMNRISTAATPSTQKPIPTRVYPIPFVFVPPASIEPFNPQPMKAFHTQANTTGIRPSYQPPQPQQSKRPLPTATFYVDPDDTEADEQVLRDLIAPPRPISKQRTPLISADTNLISILARRVLEVNQATIEARARDMVEPKKGQTRGASEPRREKSNEDRRRAPSDDKSHQKQHRSERDEEEKENHSQPHSHQPRESSHHHHHRRSSSSSSSHSNKPSSSSHLHHHHHHSDQRASSSSSSRPTHPSDKNEPDDSSRRHSKDASNSPLSSSSSTHIKPCSRPHTPPTSSLLTKEDIEMKTQDPATKPPIFPSYFFPAHGQAPPQAPIQHQPPPHTHAPAAPEPIGPLFAAPSSVPFPIMGGPPPSAAAGPRPSPVSPSTLHSRALHELRVFDTLQSSHQHLLSAAHQHSLNLVQSETEKLAALVARKEQERLAEVERDRQARIEFITRTHAIDAEREREKQLALFEANKLKEQLHAIQLQATQQTHMLQQELERQKQRAAEDALRTELQLEKERERQQQAMKDEALKAAHALELERQKRKLREEQEAVVERKMKVIQDELKQQVQQREEQHAQALAVALELAQNGAKEAAAVQQFQALQQRPQTANDLNRLKEMTQDHASKLSQVTEALKELSQSQPRLAASVTEAVKDQLQAVVSARDDRVLDALMKQQQSTMNALANVTAANAAMKGPIQVQLLGAIPFVTPTGQPPHAAAAPSFSLPLPQPPQTTSPTPSGRRRSQHTAIAAHNRSPSQSMQYSEDFENGLEQSLRPTPPTAANGHGIEEEVVFDEPQQGGTDEDYEEDWIQSTATSQPPTPRGSMKTPMKPSQPTTRTTTKQPGPAPRHPPLNQQRQLHAAGHAPPPSVPTAHDESISFEDGVEVAAAAGATNTSFHIAASPIPNRGERTNYAKNGVVPPTTASTAAATGRASTTPRSQPKANEVEIEIDFDEEDAAPIPVVPISHKAPTPKSTKSQPSPRQPMVEEIEISEDEQPEPPLPVPGSPAVTEKASEPDEIEGEVEEDDMLDGRSSSAQEIDTEPDVEVSIGHSGSYSSVPEEKMDVEEGHRTPMKQSPDQSVEYAEDFVGASPAASGSWGKPPAQTHVKDQHEIAEESMLNQSGANVSASIVKEELAASQAQDSYQSESFVGASGTSIKPTTVAAAGADVSIAEDQNVSVSEQYNESFIAPDGTPTQSMDAGSAHVAAGGQQSQQHSARSVVRGTASIDQSIAEEEIVAQDESNYTDASFHDQSIATASVEGGTSPVIVPAPTTQVEPTEEPYGDSFIDDPSHASYNASIVEELSQSAQHSLSHEQLEASIHGHPQQPQQQQAQGQPEPDEEYQPDEVSSVSVGQAQSSTTSPTSKKPVTVTTTSPPHPPIPVTAVKDANIPAVPVTSDEIEEDLSTTSFGHEEEKVQESSSEHVTEPLPSTHPSTLSKEEMVSAITDSLLQDLARDLKEESVRTKVKQANRRALKAKDTSTSTSSSSDSSVIGQLQTELLNDSLDEVDRINAIKKSRASPSSVTTTNLLSPEASPLSPPSTSNLSTPASSTTLSPLPSNELLLKASTASTTSATHSPTDLTATALTGLDGWSLDPSQHEDMELVTSPTNATATSPTSSGQFHPPTQADAIASAELNKAVEAELQRLRHLEQETVLLSDLPGQTHMKQSKEYILDLLTQVFTLERHLVDEQLFSQPQPLTDSAQDPTVTARAKFLPILSESSLVQVETKLAATSTSPKLKPGSNSPLPSASPETVEAQFIFHRLLLATCNQYIESYNQSILNRELSLTPWLETYDDLVQDTESDYQQEGSDAETESETSSMFPTPLSLSLSYTHVRRAPGGLILSLKKSHLKTQKRKPSAMTPREYQDKWQSRIIRKVIKKVEAMNSSTIAMKNAILEAISNSKIPPPMAPAAGGNVTAVDENESAAAAPRIHMTLVLEQEVALVNNILTRQMQSIEPGPAGSVQRDWKQQRGNGGGLVSMIDEVPVDLLDLSSSSIYQPTETSSTDSSQNSILYSGSECDWEGGYEAPESAHVVADIADSLLQTLIEEVVESNQAIADRKYTRKLMARAKVHEKMRSQEKNLLIPPSGSSGSSLAPSPRSNESSNDLTPVSSSLQESQERKKARRQAIKLQF